MRCTVFYSWQSDTDPVVNRNFIQDALQHALGSVRAKTPGLEPVLDRDTAGLSGSPDISNAIFAKIAVADAFVADITTINPRSQARRTPNPNVLIELGYAVATMGWDRILLIQNSTFGVPADLPFDLRGRRVVTYSLASDSENRQDVHSDLQSQIALALGAAIGGWDAPPLYAGADVPLWWGRWRFGSDKTSYGGHLHIEEISTIGFRFFVTVHHGSHTGDGGGFARFVAPGVAYAKLEGDSERECAISFRIQVDKGVRKIAMDETGDCYYHHGAGVHFSGTFLREPEPLFDAGVLDEIDLQKVYQLVGEHRDAFRAAFENLGRTDNLDEFEADVTRGFVQGLHTVIEGILMRNAGGQIWLAFIDGDVVRYFTTASGHRTAPPITIEKWRERFLDKPVIIP